MSVAILELLLVIGVAVLWVSILRDWLRRRTQTGGKGSSPYLEQCLLRVAQAEGGEVTATTVALSLGVSLAESQAALEQLCEQGFAEMNVAEDGVIFYRFPELLHDSTTPSLHLPAGSNVTDESSLRPR